MPARTSANHPKLWRKDRHGKAYGCWYVTLAGKDVNLQTQDAERARLRISEAIAGKRQWPSDATIAARAMEPTTAEFAAPAAEPLPDPPPPPAPAASAPAAPAAAASSPPVDPPPGPPRLAPMSEENAKAEADATNAAAAGTGAPSAEGAPGPTTGDPVAPDAIFPPGGMDEILKVAASAIVIGQIELQAWLIKKRTGKIAPEIPPGSKIHELAEQAWVAQFELWFPSVDSLPPIALAIGLPMLFMLKQAKEAQDPPPTNGVRPAAAAQPEAPAEPPPIGSPLPVVS